MIMIINKLNVI